MKRIHSFTLVELLVAIGIIVILAGILVPVVNGAIKKGETAKARAEMSTLVNAIKQYQGSYNRIPMADGMTKNASSKLVYHDDSVAANKYMVTENLIKSLQGDDAITIAGSSPAKKVNPKKTKFLDIRAVKGEYPDPWDNDYHIIMSADEEIPLSGNVAGFNFGTVYQSVVIWSAGPDGEWGTKDDVHSFPAEYKGSGWEVTN